MKILSTLLATTAVAASLLATISHAEARDGGRVSFAAAANAKGKGGQEPVILNSRDHRGTPSMPRRLENQPSNGAPIIRDHRGETRSRPVKSICAGWAC